MEVGLSTFFYSLSSFALSVKAQVKFITRRAPGRYSSVTVITLRFSSSKICLGKPSNNINFTDKNKESTGKFFHKSLNQPFPN